MGDPPTVSTADADERPPHAELPMPATGNGPACRRLGRYFRHLDPAMNDEEKTRLMTTINEDADQSRKLRRCTDGAYRDSQRYLSASDHNKHVMDFYAVARSVIPLYCLPDAMKYELALPASAAKLPDATRTNYEMREAIGAMLMKAEWSAYTSTNAQAATVDFGTSMMWASQHQYYKLDAELPMHASYLDLLQILSDDHPDSLPGT